MEPGINLVMLRLRMYSLLPVLLFLCGVLYSSNAKAADIVFTGSETILVNSIPTTLNEIRAFERNCKEQEIKQGEYETEEEFAARKKEIFASCAKYQSISFVLKKPLKLRYYRERDRFYMTIDKLAFDDAWSGFVGSRVNDRDWEEAGEDHSAWYDHPSMYVTHNYDMRYFNEGSKYFPDNKIILESPIVKARKLKEREPFLEIWLRYFRYFWYPQGREYSPQEAVVLSKVLIVDTESNAVLAEFWPQPTEYHYWYSYNLLRTKKYRDEERNEVSLMVYLQHWIEEERNDREFELAPDFPRRIIDEYR